MRFFFFLFLSLTFAQESEKARLQKLTTKLFTVLDVDKKLQFIKSVKQGGSGLAHYGLKIRQQDQREFYKLLKISQYENGLIKQLLSNFDDKQLNELAIDVSSVFINKIFKTLVHYEYQKLKDNQRFSASGKREKLLMELYKLFGASSVNQFLLNRYYEKEKKRKQIESLLKGHEQKMSDTQIKSLKDFFYKVTLQQLDNIFLKYTEVELAEFIRVFKNEKLIKLGLILFQYHYFFYQKTQLKIEEKAKE